MECRECKFWLPLVYTVDDRPCFDRFKCRLGWCRFNPPTKFEIGKAKEKATWPEVSGDNFCSKFAPKTSELDDLRERVLRYMGLYSWEKNCSRERLKKLNIIIKAVKKKYPKIKLREKAIEKAVEIISG